MSQDCISYDRPFYCLPEMFHEMDSCLHKPCSKIMYFFIFIKPNIYRAIFTKCMFHICCSRPTLKHLINRWDRVACTYFKMVHIVYVLTDMFFFFLFPFCNMVIEKGLNVFYFATNDNTTIYTTAIFTVNTYYKYIL